MNGIPKYPSFCFVALLLSAHDSSATEKSIYDLTLKELLEVKVITAASGFEQQLNRTASNATVITREEWRAMGAVTLEDVLATVPGLHVTDSKINNKHKLFSIRGLSGSFEEQVKIMVDGQAWESSKDGGIPNGTNIPLDLFKRIEIIKGPGSAVYGADAFAGVINLVSYSTEKNPASLTLHSGSFGLKGLSFQDNYVHGEHNFNLAVEYLKSNDDPNRIVDSDLQSQLDLLLSTNASNAPGTMDERYRVLLTNAQWRWKRLSLDYFAYQNFDHGVGVGIAQALDKQGWANNAEQRMTLSWDMSEWVEKGALDFSASYYRAKSMSHLYLFPPGTVLPINNEGNIDFVHPAGLTHFSDGLIGTPSFRSSKQHLQLTRLVEVGAHKMRWEAGHESVDFRSYESKNFGPGVLDGTQAEVSGTLTDVTDTPWVFLPDTTRTYRYLSLLDEWNINTTTILNIGARYDHYSDFGDTINPRISLLYSYSPSLSFKAFAGSAFRAPSITELYSQNNPVGFGNANLNPEKVDTLESGFNVDYLVHDNLLVSLSLFKYDAKALIGYAFEPSINGNLAQNLGRQKGNGGELLMRWKPIQSLSLNFHYSWLDAENSDGERLADTPEDMYYLDFNWNLTQRLQWYVNSKWVMNRRRASSDARRPISDYNRVNTRISYKLLTPGLTVAVGARNLFDADIREPSNSSIVHDYPQPGRQWLLELNYDF